MSFMAFDGLADGGLRRAVRDEHPDTRPVWAQLGRKPKLTMATGWELVRELRKAQGGMRRDAASVHVMRGAHTHRQSTRAVVPSVPQSSLRASRKGGVAGPATGRKSELRRRIAGVAAAAMCSSTDFPLTL